MRTEEDIEDALSLERFSRYVQWAEGSHARALELYAINMQVSEALYTPMQMLEVALRNRIHSVMRAARHDRWFEDDGFLATTIQREQVAKAVRDIKDGRKEPAPGRVVAALTFSFWTAMFSRPYEDLWQTTLHGIARRETGKGLRRKDLAAPLAPIRAPQPRRPPRTGPALGSPEALWRNASRDTMALTGCGGLVRNLQSIHDRVSAGADCTFGSRPGQR